MLISALLHAAHSTTTVMPALTDTTKPASNSEDASGTLKVVPSLSSTADSDSPCVCTFERPLTAASGYKTTADTKNLVKAINQEVIYAYGVSIS